jgi:hypothetical protein
MCSEEEGPLLPREDFWLGGDRTFAKGLNCRAMTEVCWKYETPSGVLYRAVAIIDRYLTKKHIPVKKFQCLGCVAVLMAAKFEDEGCDMAHGQSMLISAADRCFTKADLIDMEIDVLNTIEFNLRSPTAFHFLGRFLQVAGTTQAQNLLAWHLAEIALLQVRDFQYPPSHLAAAIVVSSRRLSQAVVPWTQVMEQVTGYALSDLEECLEKLSFAYNDGDSSYNGSRKKYKKELEVLNISSKANPRCFSADMNTDCRPGKGPLQDLKSVKSEVEADESLQGIPGASIVEKSKRASKRKASCEIK